MPDTPNPPAETATVDPTARAVCECGDYRDAHVLRRGACTVCRYGTPPPNGPDGCQRYRGPAE